MRSIIFIGVGIDRELKGASQLCKCKSKLGELSEAGGETLAIFNAARKQGELGEKNTCH